MAKTVVGLFDTVADAHDAIHDLESSGFKARNISMVTPDSKTMGTVDKVEKPQSKAAKGAAIGAGVGGAAGLLASLAGLTVPVIGPVLAAGPVFATLVGAGAGAATGGLIGALTKAGIPGYEAELFAEAIRHGGTLVLVHAKDNDADRAANVFRRHHPTNIAEREAEWMKKGWVAKQARPAKEAMNRVIYSDVYIYTGTFDPVESEDLGVS
ncbi:MAG: hypothetical protein HYR85_08815 [Planctomycetes bacterium]|nr:hypothetical protein [Planctomycetota bacterium]MBI3847244.1 hypothetical protein [Planctomycetota bacterium]